MALRLSYRPPLGGRTFSVAMWVLGVCLFFQVVAVLWAVVRRPSSLASTPVAPGTVFPGPAMPAIPGSSPVAMTVPRASGAMPEAFVPPLSRAPAGDPMPLSSSPLPSPGGGKASQAGTVEMASALLDIPAPPVQPAPMPVPTPRPVSPAAPEIHPAHLLGDDRLEGVMADALELRSAGDTVQALERLRTLETRLPEHPRVLQEIAVTLSQMGLASKASGYWARIQALGPEKAGAFYDLATMALSVDPLAADASKPKVLKLGQIQAEQDKDAAEGEERWIISVPVLALDGATPGAADMSIDIRFFDKAEDGTIKKTTATVGEDFVSTPYDWKDKGEEVIRVVYHQKAFTPEELSETGSRKYHGYLIKLFYRDILQDTVAEPADLAEGMDRSSLQQSRPQGPDNSLFPNE